MKDILESFEEESDVIISLCVDFLLGCEQPVFIFFLEYRNLSSDLVVLNCRRFHNPYPAEQHQMKYIALSDRVRREPQ